MRKRRRLFPGFLFILFSGPSAWAAVEYTGKLLRDPFNDPATDISAVGQNNAVQDTSDQVRLMDLQGIVLSANAKPRAIIDGAIVTIGSKVKSGVVKNIEKRGVTIFYNDKDYFLSDKGRALSEYPRIKKNQANQN